MDNYREIFRRENLASWNTLLSIVRDCEIGIEIGVCYGGNIDNLLFKTPIKKIYGIDAYKAYSDYRDMCFNQSQFDELFLNTKNFLSKYGDRFEIIRKMSDEAVNDIPDNSADFIYIDGIHLYEYVKKDILNWTPKIKKGGFICGHDYNHYQHPGVNKAVDEIFGNRVKYLGNFVWCVSV